MVDYYLFLRHGQVDYVYEVLMASLTMTIEDLEEGGDDETTSRLTLENAKNLRFKLNRLVGEDDGDEENGR